MNIKGVFQIWMHNGDYHEVPLKECHQWTREGCKMCPDFAAEHADISTGGIGKYNDWTLTIVRTDAGRDLMERMLADGVIQVRPGDDDPDAIALMHKLSRKSRKRWPEFALPEPGLVRRSAEAGVDRARLRTSTDLMDRSRISAAIPDVAFMLDGDSRRRDRRPRARRRRRSPRSAPRCPASRIVCYGPHVDDDAADAARAAGADVVLPRSRFFRDPAAAIAPIRGRAMTGSRRDR